MIHIDQVSRGENTSDYRISLNYEIKVGPYLVLCLKSEKGCVHL